MSAVELIREDFPVLARHPAITHKYSRYWEALCPYWDVLYERCPDVVQLSPPDGMAVFIGFIKAAQLERLPMDWTLYLNLYRWLSRSKFRQQVGHEQLRGLTLTAAACWCVSDRSADAGILLAHEAWPGKVVRALKADPQRGPASVEVREAHAGCPAPSWDFTYCPLEGGERDDCVMWLPIPRWRRGTRIRSKVSDPWEAGALDG